MSSNPDFHFVPEDQIAIDKRLENWAAFVRVKNFSWVSPIWKLGKSNGRQWHEPEFRLQCDTLDGMVIERAVGQLPDIHRSSLRWAYVYKHHPAKFCQQHGLSKNALAQIISDGRRMLINRRV